MSDVDDTCPKCGLRRRPGWFRCPRCREILPDEARDFAFDEATSAAFSAGGERTDVGKTAAPKWVWAAAAGVLAVLGLITLQMTGSTDPAGPAPAAEQGATPIPPSELPAAASRARPIDQVAAAAHAAGDARTAGVAAYAQGDLDKARRDFEAAVAANPDDADARNNLAQVLIRLKLPALALMHLDEAVRINPQKWAYRFNRARAYGEANRAAEAAAEYEAAAQLFPEDYTTQYNLGLMRLRLKQYAGAVTALEQAVTLAPGEPSFLLTLGTALVGVEQPDRAKAVFEKFLQQAPNDPEVPRVKGLLAALDAARQD